MVKVEVEVITPDGIRRSKHVTLLHKDTLILLESHHKIVRFAQAIAFVGIRIYSAASLYKP